LYTEFDVRDDAAAVRPVIRDLADFRARITGLLGEVPPGDFDEWHDRVRTLYVQLAGFLATSPHLGSDEVESLGRRVEPQVRSLEQDRTELEWFLRRVNDVMQRLGDTDLGL